MNWTPIAIAAAPFIFEVIASIITHALEEHRHKTGASVCRTKGVGEWLLVDDQQKAKVTFDTNKDHKVRLSIELSGSVVASVEMSVSDIDFNLQWVNDFTEEVSTLLNKSS